MLCSALLNVRKDAGQDERVLVWACWSWSLTAHSLSTRQTLLVTSLGVTTLRVHGTTDSPCRVAQVAGGEPSLPSLPPSTNRRKAAVTNRQRRKTVVTANLPANHRLVEDH